MSEQKIYSAITAVMKKITAISKDRKNQQQNFSYRGIDDVMNELHPVLAEVGVFIVPEVLSDERTERPTKSGSVLFHSKQMIRFNFIAEDGSAISATVIGEGMDSGDKASNKALSVGYKYACLQVFCIPTEDEKDPDATSHGDIAPLPPTRQQAPQGSQQRPAQKAPAKAPAMKGGQATPEERQEIKSLLESRYEDGTMIFHGNEEKEFSAMRVNITSQELIRIIKKEKETRISDFKKSLGLF